MRESKIGKKDPRNLVSFNNSIYITETRRITTKSSLASGKQASSEQQQQQSA